MEKEIKLKKRFVYVSYDSSPGIMQRRKYWISYDTKKESFFAFSNFSEQCCKYLKEFQATRIGLVPIPIVNKLPPDIKSGQVKANNLIKYQPLDKKEIKKLEEIVNWKMNFVAEGSSF